MLNFIFKLIFNLSGWKLVGGFPENLKKSIVIVAPHADWTDFPIGLGARAAIGAKMSFLGKEELFKGPFGWLFRLLGGQPVDRFNNHNVVDAVVELFNNNEILHVVLAPEGTRKAVAKLRTGFYYIAKNANVPIMMVAFDYPKKEIRVRQPFYTTDNIDGDLKEIARYFNQVAGVRKEWIKNYLEEGVME
ncbi:MAG: 1-acyl-sn-glycerol-3-phosphate acyltransferase [Bacteroidota bacterium]|jgi:1-acyl-sn-glycerol-3-phosphate acyltransferase